MTNFFFKLTLLFVLILPFKKQLIGQDSLFNKNYIGLMPSILAEPYDSIRAIEVNFFPLIYEYRFGLKKEIGAQLRPILNYRFYKAQSGFSQMGGSFVVNKYFSGLFGTHFWLKPQLAIFYTYAYNRLDKIQTMTLGIEPGAFISLSDHFSMSFNLQPGVNYYPDDFSKNFVKSHSGFKGHFGFVFHIGYHF